MIRRKLKILNKNGLHARPTLELANHALSYQSDILVSFGGREVNAKSVLGVMALGVGSGAEIELILNGSDEEEALRDLEALINNRFGEVQ